jgi:ribosome-associated heat shock protein Hsp15
VVRQRTAAAELVASGRVRLNRVAVVKPAHPVRPEDVLTITLYGAVRVLKVKEVAERRGSAGEACLLYEDLTSPPSPQQKVGA